MPLRLVRAASNRALWDACADRFLNEAGSHPGPDGHAAHLWLAHRSQRDSLFERAAGRGVRGWLAPPVSFFSDLPDRFGIRERPIGLLTGRLLVARLAAREGRRHGLETGGPERGPARAHMLDGLFSELLPEGVSPGTLRSALAGLPGDEFARRRNEWVADSYEAFLRELEGMEGRFDPRSVHAKVAERIEAGGLPAAIGGAGHLHVYGITSLRGRRRLFRALAEQGEVSVSAYLLLEDEPSEWEEALPVEEVEIVAPGTARAVPGVPEPERAVAERLPGERSPGERSAPEVQPAPDALREAAWVAHQVKRVLDSGETEPHEVAVVARSGRRDTRRVHRALRAAGVHATARIRSVLAEIPALKALLALFRAEARGWDYRSLREVLASPYLGIQVDLRIIDHIQRARRVEGLDRWETALDGIRAAVAADDGWRLRRAGVYEDRVEEAVDGLASFREAVATLAESRSEKGWVDLTLEILSGARFDLRRRLCVPPAGRHDMVRLDQRGVVHLEALLREWRELLEDGRTGDEPGVPEDGRRDVGPGVEEDGRWTGDRELDSAAWHDRLRRFAAANELAITTPLKTGVQVLEAHEAALTPYRHTFIVHANDGEFPRTSRASGVFSEEERRRLAALGLPLAGREEALRRERSLWRAVAAGESVTISYRTTDARGVPRLPSLMVPEHDPSRELPRTLDVLDRVRAAGWDGEIQPVSEAEHRRHEVQRLRAVRVGGDRAPFTTPDPARIRHAVLGAYAEEMRSGVGGESPNPWNGLVRDPAVLAQLRETFGDDYVWSATQLQSYARRPFDFFLARVLKVGEVEEAEEETSPLAFGSVAHGILERYYRRVLPVPPRELDEQAAAAYDRAAEEVCREFEADADQWLGLPILWAVTRRDVVEKVREFLARDLKRLEKEGEVPVEVERAFGGWEEGDPPPITLEGRDVRGRPARLRLRGRIDRIDRHGPEDDGWLKVVDYKSGGIPGRAGYDDGALLQSALYLKAVELLGLGEARKAVFRSIKHSTWDGSALERDRLDAVLPFALSIPARVRAGVFEAVQAASTSIADWQPGREVVRTEAARSSGSRFDPPAADHESPGDRVGA